MLHLRVFGAAPVMERVAESVAALPGAAHVTRTDAGHGAGHALVTADVDPGAADAALQALSALGVPADDVWLLRLEGLQPGRLGRRRESSAVVWADLLGQAGEQARPVARFLILMAVAGVIAAYGVFYSNGILVVGAMAVSPDFLPVARRASAWSRGARGSWGAPSGRSPRGSAPRAWPRACSRSCWTLSTSFPLA